MITWFIENERLFGNISSHKNSAVMNAFYEYRSGKIAGTDLNAYATMRLDNVAY